MALVQTAEGEETTPWPLANVKGGEKNEGWGQGLFLPKSPPALGALNKRYSCLAR